MNKGRKNNLLTALFRGYLLQCGICSGIIVVIFGLLGIVLQQVLSRYIPQYYLVYRSLYLGIAAVIVWAVCIVILTWRLLKKVVAYVDELQEAAGKLFDEKVDYIELSPKFSIVEIAIPKLLRNKTLRESNIRAKYGLNVVAIKRHDNLIISPLPTEVLMENDIAIVVGSNESINGLEELEK